MKNRLYLSLVVIALLCLAGWTAQAQLQRSSPARQTWEHKLIYIRDFADPSGKWYEDGRQLASSVNMVTKSKELGDQGWELVSVMPLSTSSNYNGLTTDLAYWFKRPK